MDTFDQICGVEPAAPADAILEPVSPQLVSLLLPSILLLTLT